MWALCSQVVLNAQQTTSACITTLAGQGAGKCYLYLPALTARTHGVTLRFKDKRTLTLLTWQHIITLRTSSLPCDGELDLSSSASLECKIWLSEDWKLCCINNTHCSRFQSYLVPNCCFVIRYLKKLFTKISITKCLSMEKDPYRSIYSLILFKWNLLCIMI